MELIGCIYYILVCWIGYYCIMLVFMIMYYRLNYIIEWISSGIIDVCIIVFGCLVSSGMIMLLIWFIYVEYYVSWNLR